MESVSHRRDKEVDPWAVEDPRGPMMHWEGDRSEEDVQWMSNWFLARKAELENEKANSAAKAE